MFQVVQKAVRNHGIVVAAWQPRIRQIAQVIADALRQGVLFGVRCCQFQHRAGRVDAEDLAVGQRPGQTPANITRATAKIQDCTVQRGPEPLHEKRDKIIVRRTEISAGIGQRLGGIIHKFGFGYALDHGTAQKSGSTSLANRLSTVSRWRTTCALSPSTSISAARGRLL